MKGLSRISAVALLVAATFSTAHADNILHRANDLSWGGSESLDPISPEPFYYMNELLYNRLVREAMDGTPESDLAVEWTSSVDAKEWTFKLREGVKFHDGSDLDASDVVYSFTRIKDPSFESPVTSVLEFVDHVEAIDPLTVKIVLSKPHADLPTVLMHDSIRIIADGSGDTIAQTGNGTGPFKIESYDPEGTTTLVANENYWEGKPKLDGMDFVAIPDTEARVQALLAGQIDTESISPEQIPMFSDTSKFEIQNFASGGWLGIIFRTDTPPFDNPKVRKALRIAANREQMIDLVAGKGAGTLTCDHPVWMGDVYRADISCPQDIEQAKALLAEAGYPNGIDVEVYTSDLEPMMIRLAEVYQQQVYPAGIRVAIKMAPGDGYWNDVWMVKPVTITSWDERPADTILNEAYRSSSSWNETYYNNPAFDELLDKARQELDFTKRREIYKELEQTLFEDGGSFIPFHTSGIRVVAANVKGMPHKPSAYIRWHLVEKVEQ